MIFRKPGFYLFSLLGILLFACNKEKIITSSTAMLKFSTDTVYFDTILANLGSVTQRFKIYNPHNNPIVIKNLYLGGGSSSYYKLNVDGTPGNSQSNIELAAHDSIYVFVEVTINPKNKQNPFIIADSVICLTNGNEQNVKLVAYGQDVHLYHNEYIKSGTWSGDIPYLIVGVALLDSAEVLHINPGTRIYLASQSMLYIKGKLDAEGTLENPILFTGARFDGYYENAAGQWGTIYFHPNSTGNYMKYVTIKNAVAGIQIGYPGYDHVPDLKIEDCMILNSQIMGIYAFNAKITAYNIIVADAGQSLLRLFMGGDYNFYQCTFSNISARLPKYLASGGYIGRSEYSLEFTNFYHWYQYTKDYWIDSVTYTNDLNLNFYNSILYGVKDEEIKFKKKGSAKLDYTFNNCLIKNNKDSLKYSDHTHFDTIILNKDPRFINDSASLAPLDLELDTLSPAINAGDMKWIQDIPSLRYDYNGNDRTIDGKPDLGAYEWEEK